MNRVKVNGLEMLRLELGCGDAKHQRAEYLHLDIVDRGQDCVWDITRGLPFPDDSCAEIYASHTFEHISRQDLIVVLNECWRCIHPGGMLWVVVPAYNAESAYIIPHITQFSEATFRHLTGDMNPDYDSLADMHSRVLMSWTTTELVTNERPDIHWKATPKGK